MYLDCSLHLGKFVLILSFDIHRTSARVTELLRVGFLRHDGAEIYPTHLLDEFVVFGLRDFFVGHLRVRVGVARQEAHPFQQILEVVQRVLDLMALRLGIEGDCATHLHCLGQRGVGEGVCCVVWVGGVPGCQPSAFAGRPQGRVVPTWRARCPCVFLCPHKRGIRLHMSSLLNPLRVQQGTPLAEEVRVVRSACSS